MTEPTKEVEVQEQVEDVEVGNDTKKRPTYGSKQSSTLDTHDDPFAAREGKTLVWKNVNMTLVGCGGLVLLGRVLKDDWIFLTNPFYFDT